MESGRFGAGGIIKRNAKNFIMGVEK